MGPMRRDFLSVTAAAGSFGVAGTGDLNQFAGAILLGPQRTGRWGFSHAGSTARSAAQTFRCTVRDGARLNAWT
jgi:hypothetical protein